MTLVLPAAAYCGNHAQQAAKPVFTSATTRNSNSTSMPCVFDGEPLDFESALMTDWPTLKDIADYDNTVDEDADKNNASGSSERESVKRMLSCDDGTESVEVKRPRNDEPEASTSYNSGVTSQSSSSSSSDCSSPEKELADHEDMDDDLFFRRRTRVSHLWNSRQRWKDERKKVLKMSIKKLTEIEDPELLLLRSVLINNTIKRLHQDIRNERQAKMRHRMQRHDYFCNSTNSITDRLTEPSTSSRTNSSYNTLPSTSYHNQQQDYNNTTTTTTASKAQKEVTPPSLYDDSSCDEIFSINEDFLRVTIPDRRVSSPIPPTTVQEDEESSSSSRSCQNEDSPMNFDGDSRTTNCSSSTPASPASFSRSRTERPSPSYPSPLPSPRPRQVPSPSNQCATQYRTQQDCITSSSSGDSSFPPRVPILDSVVYHSLLASLES